MRKVQLSNGAKTAGPVHLAAVESDLLGSLTQLIAHVTHTRYDDGSPRRTGTIGIRTQGASWVCEARDYDAAARMRAVAQSLDDVLVLIDTLLGADEAPWEPDIYLQDQTKLRKGGR